MVLIRNVFKYMPFKWHRRQPGLNNTIVDHQLSQLYNKD